MSSTLVSLFAYKAWANAELHNALATFDVRQYPAEWDAMLQILDHANVVDRIFQGHLTGAVGSAFHATQSDRIPDLPALREAVSATDGWYLEFVSSVSEERLKQRIPFTFVDGDRGTMSCEEMLLHVITHACYHRGSVGQMLEDLGLDSPPDSLTKFLHRLEPGRRLHSEG